jgi:Lrp/AsnC family transcriptional regulator, leucine-responsive regulatory protein
MNRSRYVIRPLDTTDRAIVLALHTKGRITIRDLAEQIGLSSPSVTERILKMEDSGAIRGYSIIIDPKVFGLDVVAHLRILALPGLVDQLLQLLIDTPEIVEADRTTGDDCFLAKAIVRNLSELESLIDRFLPFSSISAFVVLSSPVVRRLPRI